MSTVARPDARDLPSLGPDTDHEDLGKSGDVIRRAYLRVTEAACVENGCPATFTNPGAAWAHARWRRHRVDVVYTTEFSFIPDEDVAAEVDPA